FCIVSSDSDFARLAARIREQGVTVYGFGERKTPRPFITACDKFVYFDVLSGPAPDPSTVDAPAVAKPTGTKPVAKPSESTTLDQTALDMLAKAIAASADEDGRANLARVGSVLAKQSPDFDARNYGYARLTDLMEATGIVTVERVGENPKVVMVRLKQPESNGRIQAPLQHPSGSKKDTARRSGPN
ncbi:MAG: NYN domain-containing protein, partial [Lysobacteraceae bacterium]